MVEQIALRVGGRALIVVLLATCAGPPSLAQPPAGGRMLPAQILPGQPIRGQLLPGQPLLGNPIFFGQAAFDIPDLPPGDGKTFTSWLISMQFVRLLRRCERAKCYPVEIEGKTENGGCLYRAKFGRAPGEKYFAFETFPGSQPLSYDECVKGFELDCYRRVYTHTFVDGQGIERHCGIWIRTFPILVRVLASSQNDVQRVRAVSILRDVGRDDIEVQGVLLRALQRCDSAHVRAAAAGAIGFLRVDPERSADGLVAALKSDLDRQVLLTTISSLGRFPKSAAHSVPLLINALQSDDKTMRSTAIIALAKIYRVVGILKHLPGRQDDLRETVELLVRLMDVPVPNAPPAVAVNAIGAILLPRFNGRQAKVPFNDPTKYLRSGVIQDLARLGRDAAPAVPKLLTALRDDPSKMVRNAAATALPKIAPERPEVVAALAESMERDSECRGNCVKALRAIGPSAEQCLGAVQRVLKRTHSRKLRGELFDLLGVVGGDSPEVGAILLDIFKTEEDLTMRARTSVALARVAPSATVDGRDPRDICFAQAQEQFQVSKQFAKAQAARAMGILGARAESAIPDLIEATGHKSFSVQVAAVTSLGQMGPAAHDAVPVIAALLKEKSWRLIPPVAAQALGNMGPVAKDAIPALKECLDSSHRGLQQAAAEALEKIEQD